MKRALVERNIAVALFILVLVIFSFAERDTRKLKQLYPDPVSTQQAIVKPPQFPVKSTVYLSSIPGN